MSDDVPLKCPHCDGAFVMARSAIPAMQTFTCSLIASNSRRLAATTVGETIIAVAKSVEETGRCLGQNLTVFLESVVVTDGRVEITMIEGRHVDGREELTP